MPCPSCEKRLKKHNGVCAEHNQQLVYCTNPDCWLSYVVGCDTYLRNSKSSNCNPPLPEVKNLTETEQQSTLSSQSSLAITPKAPSGVASFGASEDFSIWVKKDITAIEFVESQIVAIQAWLKHEKAKLETEKAS